MADDRADEIARETVRALATDVDVPALTSGEEDRLATVIAAALRAYGREMVDAKLDDLIDVFENAAANGGTMAVYRDLLSLVRSLKSSKPEAQDTQT